MWTVEDPVYLLLLLVLIPGIYFSHFYRGRGGVFIFPLGLWEGDNFKPKKHFWQVILFLSTFLFWVGTALMIVALAGPVKVEKEKIYLSRGIDIMFVLDESPSMAAGDFPPINRFETAKTLILEFMRGRENDALGLVSFSGEAALRVPPTLDYRAFAAEVEALRIMTLGEGTSVGLGLAIAALHEQGSSADEKVIILMTDGENNSGEIAPLSAARIAADMGIRIYAIGIGSEGRFPLEYQDPDTGKIYRGIYESGFNEELLEEIALLSSGKYFSAVSPGAMEQIFRTIDSLESRETRVKIKVSTTPGYRIVIFAGFLSILLSFIIRKIILREVF
ncbi:MAG: VWA domain-containing protein [Spirochaetales bacterium]|nr:VWA domain-containing protein [Spirochaetales bacterium]